MIDWLTGISRALVADWPLPPAADWAGPKAVPFEVFAAGDEPPAWVGAGAAGAASPPAAGAPTAAALDAVPLLELLLPEHAVRVAEAMTRPVTAEKRKARWRPVPPLRLSPIPQ